jgi:predicted chitinase
MANLIDALKAGAPALDAATWAPALQAAFAKFSFNTNKRMAAALGQFLVEAGPAFHSLHENLFYTHPERIQAVFGHARFPTPASAQPYVKNPEKLANFVYANRFGNGDEASGDGFKFRGGGLIQLTFRDTYAKFGQAIGKSADDAAAYCETNEGAAMSGCWYLSDHGCLPLADAWNIAEITHRVNSASLEHAQRLANSNAMLAALSD